MTHDELCSDTQLIERCLGGDHEAFGPIVERYQGLLCALAYSGCGDVGRSEDLAQETFLAAWRNLGSLKDRGRLKQWLCGIARHLVQDSHRRTAHDPISKSTPLEESAVEGSESHRPSERAISAEEQAILWRVLEGLPMSYREPLILFYRQDQSIALVAEALDLSEDAVKQRLSRGRTMISERMARFVETTLQDSSPGKAFTGRVLAGLPLIASSAKAGAVSITAAKGGAAAKSAGLLGLLGPLGMILSIYFGYKLDSDDARSSQRQQMIARFYRILVAYIAVFTLAVLSLILVGWPLALSHPRWFAGMAVALGPTYLVGALILVLWMQQRKRRIREQEIAEGRAVPLLVPLFEYKSKLSLLGWPLIHIRIRGGLERGPVKAWIAAGDAAIGLIFAFGAIAVAPFSFGGLAVGLLTMGGVAVGIMPFGGFSFGPWALGAFAFGWRACGPVAVGWSAAQGIVAVARDYAAGVVALAQHANDPFAEAFFRNNAFFQTALSVTRHAAWLSLLCLLPPALWWWRRKKSKSGCSRLN